MFTQPFTLLFPVLACIVAAILWGLLWYPLRILELNGVPGLWATLLMYVVSMLAVIKPCWRLRYSYTEQPYAYLFLALAAGWTNLAFILAMLAGEVVRVLLLFYLSPVWAILLAIPVLKEKIRPIGVVALLLAMTGAVTMLWQPNFFSRPISLADSLALTAGMAFAMTNVLVRKIGNVHWSLKLGSAWIGVIVLSILGLLLFGVSAPQINPFTSALILVLGFPFLFVMTWTAQYGVTHLPIQTSSIIFLLEIVAGAVSAALLTTETMTLAEYMGGSLIIMAGLVGIWKKQQAGALYEYSS